MQHFQFATPLFNRIQSCKISLPSGCHFENTRRAIFDRAQMRRLMVAVHLLTKCSNSLYGASREM